MFKTNRSFIVCLLLVLQWFIAMPVLALSDAVKIDIATGQLIAFLEQGNDAAVITATKKLRMLKVEDSRLDFFDGEALFNMRQFNKAQSALEAYVNTTGRKAEFYQDAISLLGKLESMFASTNGKSEKNTRRQVSLGKQAILGKSEPIVAPVTQPKKATISQTGLNVLGANQGIKSFSGVSGTYESSGSSVVIVQVGDEVTGTYDNGKGKIYGTLLEGYIFRGLLFPDEVTNPRECDKEKSGSNYWQSFYGIFTATGFSGNVRECGLHRHVHRWKATLVKASNEEVQNKVMDQMLDSLLAK